MSASRDFGRIADYGFSERADGLEFALEIAERHGALGVASEIRFALEEVLERLPHDVCFEERLKVGAAEGVIRHGPDPVVFPAPTIETFNEGSPGVAKPPEGPAEIEAFRRRVAAEIEEVFP